MGPSIIDEFTSSAAGVQVFGSPRVRVRPRMKLFLWAAMFLFLGLPVRKSVRFDAVLDHGDSEEVFQYVSSVDNFQKLNPTILGISHHRKVNETTFYLEYSEHLSQIPAIKHHARAFYWIQQRPGTDERSLASQHETCFLSKDSLCLTTDSVLTISKRRRDEVAYREDINFSCPWILSWFCYREVQHQRNLIILQLNKVFSGGKTTTNEYRRL